MTTDLEREVEIHRALELAKQTPHFVFLNHEMAPHVRESLEAYASESGKQLLAAAAPSRVQLAAAEFAQRDIPTISAGDDRAFLKNLSKIARGDVRVRPDD